MTARTLVRPNADEEWQPYYSNIRSLWWDEDQTLTQLMTTMKNEFGFVATEKQYKRMLEKWDLGKNVKTQEMRAMVKILLRRQPKETEFRLRDRPVPQAKIDRFLLRTMGTQVPSPSAFSPLAFTPSQIRYYTPKATYQQTPRCTTPRISSPGTPLSDGWMSEFIHMPSSQSSIHLSALESRNGSLLPAATPTLLSSSLVLPPHEIVEILMEHHSGIRNSPIDLFRVFCWAVAENNEELKSQVLKQRVTLDSDLRNPDSGTIIHYMAKHGECGFLCLLLDQGGDPNSVTQKGRTSLSLAVTEGNETVVQLLLERKANPNIHHDPCTKPPLHQAIFTGKTSLVRKLLSRGASVSLRSAAGEAPLHLALGRTALLAPEHAPLAVQQQGWLPLFEPIDVTLEGDETMVQLLLDAGACITDIDGDGDTALHRAVKLGRADIVMLLRGRGAPWWILNSAGYAPLHCAIAQGNWAIAELLIDHGASMEHRTESGSLPLHIAVTVDPPNPVLVRALLDKGNELVSAPALNGSGATAADLVRHSLLKQACHDIQHPLYEILRILESAEEGHCWCTVCTQISDKKGKKCSSQLKAENHDNLSEWFSLEQNPLSWGSSVDCTF